MSRGFDGFHLLRRQDGKHVIVLRPATIGLLKQKDVVRDLLYVGRFVSLLVGKWENNAVLITNVVPVMRSVSEARHIDCRRILGFLILLGRGEKSGAEKENDDPRAVSDLMHGQPFKRSDP
jgi:hypothetical protein